ncbi:hypothetical protein [Flavobacterium wongokense]|uniref:hypothetical protein n=1 Tax=Flavobacterium wongokense TaxID=2910674 RepID=UPI001F328FE4|nr:hypothetical protein [Flavobacterium sp. WG47]MCF6131861.1 hypothetical protein [Flavobacterium sp. WG47]
MKTKILSLTILFLWSVTSVFAQDRTTVTATNSDISDNLDLRAVASIFGDSRDLADFERRLNDPNAQISNLDLNGDNRVDYLRVIETVEGSAHLIIIQSVLGLDTFQDIATVEVERDRYNKVQVQVVGDVYMYGNNYIYEPVYAYTPVIYTTFWVSSYRPYYSSWYWGYYPSFYVAWSPFPVYTYHNHIGIYINHHHHYNYVNYRNCSVAYNNYYNGRRGNAYERQYPGRSFAQRNTGYTNRRELVQNRKPQVSNTRGTVANNNTRNNTGYDSPRGVRGVGSNEVKGGSTPRTQGSTRGVESPRSVSVQNGREVTSESTPRTYGNTRNGESPRTYGSTGSTESPRTYGSGSSETPRTYGNTRSTESPRSNAPQGNSRGYESPRSESPRSAQRNESPRSSAPREYSQQRENSQPRGGGGGNSRGNGNRRG